ncbi:MAG: cob(I)yrinic acid a,c-diamide adenosyltransferase [Desulfatiglandaceae bacterium]
MLNTGLVQLYYGVCAGASDSTNYAPFGLAMRACGRNLRTLIIGFSPADYWIPLKRAASFLAPYLVIDCALVEGLEPDLSPSAERGIEGFRKAEQSLAEGRFDLIILDGIMRLVVQGIFKAADILRLMRDKPGHVELVLTGFGADDQIIQQADLVTEMVVRRDPRHVPSSAMIEGRDSIKIVTGNGKGKTTYCLGEAMVAACSGSHAFVLQVIKSPRLYGEIKGIRKIPHLEVRTMGEGFLDHGPAEPGEKHLQAARSAWAVWLQELYSMKYDLLVLDEINIATHYGLIPWERVKEMLLLKPEHLRLLLSGRDAHPEIIETAETLIEMREVKHPYKKGVKAREGIEF